jgi:protein-S-isoprenylcysteine O-methyltransferase Ste14
VALPPLIYLFALLLSSALHLFAPLVLPLPAAVRVIAGVMGLASVLVMGKARRAFVRAGTNVNPMKPALSLVEAGPFRLSRNPMYVGMAIAFACLALAIRNGWLLVLMIPVLALMHWGVILREERYLAAKFGAEYEAYRNRVRRYF